MKNEILPTSVRFVLVMLFLLGTALVGMGWGQPAPAEAQAALTRRVNVPYTGAAENIPPTENAIFWFGDVGPVNGTNPGYADGRAIFNDEWVQVVLHVFDHHLYYDETPQMGDFAQWDGATLYLSRDGNVGDAPDAADYRFAAQLNNGSSRDPYQAVFRGDGGGWTAVPDFAWFTRSGWRGNWPNDDQVDRGWWIMFRVPFSELGLNGRPSPGTTWGMALALHDRDTANNVPDIPDQHWPESAEGKRPFTWGQLRFGLPTPVTPPVSPAGSTLIRHGHNGAAVPDGQVGGNANCSVPPLSGSEVDYWQSWGDLVYYRPPGHPEYDQVFPFMTYFNVQNQWDVSDWPCFSKYYVTFPLDGIPTGRQVASATLTMHLFGNAGAGDEVGPQPSYIQVLTVGESWQLDELNWNEAPLAAENVARTWVEPLPENGDPTHVPYQWDVSGAAAAAHAAGQPLRLALYSADNAYHSGKYFRASDFYDETKRPSLLVEWGEPFQPSHWIYLPLAVR